MFRFNLKTDEREKKISNLIDIHQNVEKKTHEKQHRRRRRAKDFTILDPKKIQSEQHTYGENEINKHIKYFVNAFFFTFFVVVVEILLVSFNAPFLFRFKYIPLRRGSNQI